MALLTGKCDGPMFGFGFGSGFFQGPREIGSLGCIQLGLPKTAISLSQLSIRRRECRTRIALDRSVVCRGAGPRIGLRSLDARGEKNFDGVPRIS